MTEPIHNPPTPILDGNFSFVFAGGGTGGHLYPGLAVAGALEQRLGRTPDIIWAATPRAVDRRLLMRFGEKYIAQMVQPMKRNPLRWPGFYIAWRSFCRYWQNYFIHRPPSAVLALGGYAAGPAAYVAHRMGIPVALLNPDALPGLANRFLMAHVDRIFAQWPMADSQSRKFQALIHVSGCPIRFGLVGLGRAEGIRRLGLDPARRTLVVTGASLGARTINDAMVELRHDREFLELLNRPHGEFTGWQVLLLTGMEQAAAIGSAMVAASDGPQTKNTGARHWHLLDYADDMAAVWAASDLVIARAGAGTCAELTACGLPSILLPYPHHRDQHQRVNARNLEQAGAAILLTDQLNARKNAVAIKEVFSALLMDRPRLRTMAESARRQGKPDAAGQVADWLIEQGIKRPINNSSRVVQTGVSPLGT